MTTRRLLCCHPFNPLTVRHAERRPRPMHRMRNGQCKGQLLQGTLAQQSEVLAD
jgi:hypothetical protein